MYLFKYREISVFGMNGDFISAFDLFMQQRALKTKFLTSGRIMAFEALCGFTVFVTKSRSIRDSCLRFQTQDSYL